MSLLITLDVFSGRPNPHWLLRDEEERAFRSMIEAGGDPTPLQPSGSFGHLGYRGFLVQDPEELRGEILFRVHEGILDQGPRGPNRDVRDRKVESFLLGTAGDAVSEPVRSHIEEVLEPEAARLEVRERYVPYELTRAGCQPCRAKDAPSYDPARWNVPAVQPHNNCYNYANDQMTNTFAQPGRATGGALTGTTCGTVEAAAQSDGLRPHRNSSDPLGSKQGWYVALVIWPRADFHWYRQDEVGCWSHKPGGTLVRDADNGGNRITDPQLADRGPYTDFCTNMVTRRQVQIR